MRKRTDRQSRSSGEGPRQRRTGPVWRVRLVPVVFALAAACAAAVLGTPAASAAQAPAAPGKAWIRAAHLVPGLSTARIDLAPAGAAPGAPASVVMSPEAAYGDVTGYQKLTPGTYTLTVRAADAAPDSAPMLSRRLTVEADRAYTLAALGTAASPRLATLLDDLTPPPAAAARIRVLPAVSRATELTVTAQDGPTIATGAVLGQVTPYAAVPRGRWTLVASADGLRPGTGTVDVAPGSVYTVLVLDGPGGQPRIRLVTDAAGAAAAPAGGAATGGGGTAPGLKGGARAGGAGFGGSVPVAAFTFLGLLTVAVGRRLARPHTHR